MPTQTCIMIAQQTCITTDHILMHPARMCAPCTHTYVYVTYRCTPVRSQPALQCAYTAVGRPIVCVEQEQPCRVYPRTKMVSVPTDRPSATSTFVFRPLIIGSIACCTAGVKPFRLYRYGLYSHGFKPSHLDPTSTAAQLAPLPYMHARRACGCVRGSCALAWMGVGIQDGRVCVSCCDPF